MAYYDRSPATASNRKFKYLSAVSGMDASSFAENTGYWVYANEAGNLTLSGVGGSLTDETYLWSELRFNNGTDEVNVSDAGSGGWIESTLRYWSIDDNDFALVDNSGLAGTKNTISSWEGVFVYGYKDNITLIRQN